MGARLFVERHCKSVNLMRSARIRIKWKRAKYLCESLASGIVVRCTRRQKDANTSSRHVCAHMSREMSHFGALMVARCSLMACFMLGGMRGTIVR